MTDTTQAELMALAQKHRDTIGVRALLLSISEARDIARHTLAVMGQDSEVMQKAVEFEEGYWVGIDHSRMVATTANASAALTNISILLKTLASTLSSLGEEVSY
jgi:hypothetical protein